MHEIDEMFLHLSKKHLCVNSSSLFTSEPLITLLFSVFPNTQNTELIYRLKTSAKILSHPVDIAPLMLKILCDVITGQALV